MSEKPFNENMAESRKVGELKRDAHYSCVSFVVHTLIIKKGWIDALFLQVLKHNTWVSIPVFVWNGLTQNVKMDHKKKFHGSLQNAQFFPCKDACTLLRQRLNLEACTIFVKSFWFFRILKQEIE